MNFPQISNKNVSGFLDKEEIVRATAEQIMKDFGMFGVEITFSGDINHAYDELFQQLSFQISDLLRSNYKLLLAVLYQVDITNRDLERTEQELPHYTHVEVIAHQVIFRDLKKVLLRRYFKSKKQD